MEVHSILHFFRWSKENVILTAAHTYLGTCCLAFELNTKQKVLLSFIAGLPPSQMHPNPNY